MRKVDEAREPSEISKTFTRAISLVEEATSRVRAIKERVDIF